MRTKYVEKLWKQINDLTAKLDSREDYIRHLHKRIEELTRNSTTKERIVEQATEVMNQSIVMRHSHNRVKP